MSQELVMFWAKDSYPFVLTAKLEKFSTKHPGYAQPEGYGGFSFKPLLVMPLNDDAREFVKKLNELEREYGERERDLKAEMLGKLHRALPFTKEIK